jgi:GNAT superfamily N-acetyltransferase
MADVIVDPIAPEDVNILVGLYNQMFRPSRDVASFESRYRQRPQVLQLVARLHDRPVGFLAAYEIEPGQLFLWIVAVLPSDRRQGIASQLLEAAESWARENDYELLRAECLNRQRGMLHFLLAKEFDLVGLRWDTEQMENQIQFHKMLN